MTMKKLMVAALAAVAMVFCASAVNVQWKCTGAKSDVGTTVYILKAKPAEGGYEMPGNDFWELVVSRAAIARAGKDYFASDAIDGLTDAQAGSLYALYFTQDGDTSKKYTYYGSLDGSSGTLSFAFSDLVENGSTGEITPGPTPEPTSGLLLLIGMGALALKRRRT